MIRKTCNVCHQKLSLQHFARNSSRPDGLQPTCRACNHRRYMAQNQDRKKLITLYPDDEIVEELIHRGNIYRLLRCIDRHYLLHFLKLPVTPGTKDRD